MALTQIRGAPFFARREWIRAHKGPEGIGQMLEVLSPAGRSVLRGEIDKAGWYNYPLFIELVVAMDEQFGDGDGKLNIEAARWAAHLNTRSIFKMFIRLGSPAWVLDRASKLWREHFNVGAFEITASNEDSFAEGEIIDFPHPHLCFTYSVLGFAIGAIEMSGAQLVRGEVLACQSRGADRTRLRIRWGAPVAAE